MLKEDDVLELSENTGDDEWIVPITVNYTIMPFKPDTGAQANLMSEADYRQLSVKSKMYPARTRVRGYTGERVPVKGRCVVTFEHRGQRLKAQLLIVAQEVQPILGLKACENLNLVKRVYVVASQPQGDQHPFMEEYRDVFEGLGCLPGEHKIHIEESVAPVVRACRKVPFALREKLKEELARMEKLKVIQKVDEPTD